MLFLANNLAQISPFAGKVLVYNGDIWQPTLFHTCVYSDYPLGLLFTSWAQEAGAVAVINRGKPGESGVCKRTEERFEGEVGEVKRQLSRLLFTSGSQFFFIIHIDNFFSTQKVE
jgi:hypothetical protein